MKTPFCRTWLLAWALIALASVAAMLSASTTAPHALQQYDLSTPLTRIPLQGSFRIGNAPWLPYPPQTMNVFRSVGSETVEFSGHTLIPVPQGQRVFVYVRHIRAQIAVNGATVFAIGEEDSQPAFTQTPGNLWASFISPGINPDDKITLSLQRVSSTSPSSQIAPFLENIQYGSLWNLLQRELLDAWWAIPVVPLFVTMSIMLIFLVLHFAWRKETKLAVQGAFLAGTYSSVGFWSLVNYKMMSLILPFPTLIMTWETVSFMSGSTFIVLYVSTLLTEIRYRISIYTASLLLMVLTACIALQLAGYMDLFVIQNALHLLGFCSVVGCIGLAFMERKSGGQASAKAFMTFVPLCALGGMDAVLNILGEVTNGVYASIGFLITSAWQFGLLVNAAYRNMQEANRLEREVLESRIAVSLSQIRPHFLYNALTSIQYLCSEDPAKAERAITDFTAFLRGNLDSLSRGHPILLSQEMEHVQHYLALEQLRFGDKLCIEWSLEPQEILVPALSIQPLVENAVRWGMREDGLTVRITTHMTDKGYAITVQDDGMGFTPQTAPRGTGVGLGSVRTRVCELQGGSLEIDSAPGKGTVVTLTFPALSPVPSRQNPETAP